MSTRHRNDYPVGIPLRPPPGWKGRGASVPPPLHSRSPKLPARGLALQAGLVALMVFVCTTVGWLAVDTPRRPRAKPHPARVASVPFAQPAAREEPKPVPPEPAKEPISVAPRQPKEPAPAALAPPKEATPSAAVLTYERDILPILQRSCLGCHGKAKKRGKLDLSTYAAALKGGEEGMALVPGKPDESPILTTILEGKMPPGGKKMPPRDIRMIREWIQGGARTESSK